MLWLRARKRWLCGNVTQEFASLCDTRASRSRSALVGRGPFWDGVSFQGQSEGLTSPCRPIGRWSLRCDRLGWFVHCAAGSFCYSRDDLGVVKKAVQLGRGGRYNIEELAPLFDGPIGGHQWKSDFILVHDDCQENFAAENFVGFGRQGFEL